MIFFAPKDLMDLAEGDRGFSLARLIFGERIEGFPGNGAEYKWVSRFPTAETKLTHKATKKLFGLIADNTRISSPTFDQIASVGPVKLLNLSPWFAFTHGADLTAGGNLIGRLPRTLDLVVKLDILSKVAGHYAETNDRNALSRIVNDLPLSSPLVQDWVCRRLKAGNDKDWDEVFFPLRVVVLFATLLHMSDEADEGNDSTRPKIGQVFWSRDNETGNPRPFRPCFARLLEVTGETTFNALFENIFTCAERDRVRQGRKYMAAPPDDPKTKACSSMVRNAQSKYKLDPEIVYEIEMMFFFARLLTGIYVKCGKLLTELPGITPNAIMHEWGIGWRLDQTEDADILRQMDTFLSQLQSSSERSSQSSGRSS